jgi:hypothetical protein
MLNGVNSFKDAKMSGAKDLVFQAQYNFLIDILQRQIKTLNAKIGNGLILGSDGTISLGNELTALQLLADTSGFLKKTGDGTYSIDVSTYQPYGNELAALQALADTAGFLTKTGDATYSIDTNTYVTVANVLTLDNTAVFTPDADYEPATKKYVDDNVSGGLISDTAYGVGWDGVTTIAPSKNAVYDKIEALTVGAGITAEEAIAYAMIFG